MASEELESLLENTFELCENASRGVDVMAKAERAVAFHRKLVEQKIFQLGSELEKALEDKLDLCEKMLKEAQSASGMGATFNTMQRAHREDTKSNAEVSLPLDVLALIIDQVERSQYVPQNETTLLSLALCNKTFYFLAQPRLYSVVRIQTFSRLVQCAYALALQPRGSRGPLLGRKLDLRWTFSLGSPYHGDRQCQLSTNRLISMILAMSPSITALSLMWKSAQMHQSDVDALGGFFRLTPQLESLTLIRCDMDICGPSIAFEKGMTDRLSQLRSFTLWDMGRNVEGIWPFFTNYLGPALRRIELCIGSLDSEQLHQIAKCSPQLAKVVVKCKCRASYAEISRFIKMLGSSLTRLELDSIDPPDPAAETLSLVFESLVLHAKDIEVVSFGITSALNKDDFRVLAQPGCLPRLKELAIDGFPTSEMEEETNEPHPCEEAIAAVLESHKTTLEWISFDTNGEEELFGDVFVQACLRLDRIQSIRAEFRCETSLTLLERLHQKNARLASDLLGHVWRKTHRENPCVACLLVNDKVVSTHTLVNNKLVKTHSVDACLQAAGIDPKELKPKQWPEAEEYGYCSKCFIPISLHSSEIDQSNGSCGSWKKMIKPAINLVAARNPAWNHIGEDGEPAYWRPILRSLCRLKRGH